jgi:hypothetical protein
MVTRQPPDEPMSEAGSCDAWHDALLARIRERALENRRQHSPTPQASLPIYNWPEVSSRLSRASAVAVADATISLDRRHTGLRRELIFQIRGLIAYLLRFLTSRQTAYNLDVLQALRETGRGLRALEQRLAQQDQDIGQLRNRISHLEKQLPVELNCKAS